MSATKIRARAALCLALLPACACFQCAAQRPSSDAILISVSPQGNDDAPGTRDLPFRTLQRAKQAVRQFNSDHNVTVELADGIYRLSAPLVFTAPDGGRNLHHVVWQAAPGARPIVSGAMPVAGWKLYDKSRNIYVADVPTGTDARELWVNDKLVPRAFIEIPRADLAFTTEGIVWKDPKYNYLAQLPEQNRLEIESTGFFTDRFSPVEQVAGREIRMKQPAWENNIWGYDTISSPYHPELSHVFLINSLAFISKPGDWFIDPAQGKLYLCPPAGTAPDQLQVELPRITVLMAIGDSLNAPVKDLTFTGIQFSHTTWMGPSGDEGYASQQSGSYLKGHAAAYPENPLTECRYGCPAFESRRNEWTQMPTSIQVAAAERITFDGDVFAHLGQYALGIGNAPDANITGAGLGAADITVTRCVFTDLAGGAILSGGVRPDAHHPHDPRQTNRSLIIRNNRIRSVSKEYRDNSAILSTYVLGAILLHNDISDVPYDAIDIGYGWGINDPGGNPNYRVRLHGYDWKENLVYDTPTTHRDVAVAANRIHDAKKYFHDGGAIYNLSASPGTLITENYIFNNNEMIALYLDEGSRYITVRRNVVACKDCEWLNINTVHAAYPLRISPDNIAIDNWHQSTKTGGMWTNYQNDLILNDHLVQGADWPAEAREIMKNAGIETSAGPVEYEDAKPAADETTSEPK